MPDSHEIERRVLAALENPSFRWRTVGGVASEAQVEPSAVLEVLKDLGDVVVRSNVPSTSGEPLFTTRKHYLESSSKAEQFLGALKNRIL